MRFVLWLALLLAPALCAEEVELADLLRRSAGSANPSLSFLSGLGELRPGTVERDELWVLLDDLDGAGIELPTELVTILESTESIRVEAGEPKQVQFSFHQDVAPLQLGPGWAHLQRQVSFALHTSEGVRLEDFAGFKLSKKPDSWIKVKLREVSFETRGDAAVARVDAGPGGVHVVAVGAAAPAPIRMADRERPQTHTEGILGALEDEIQPKSTTGKPTTSG